MALKQACNYCTFSTDYKEYHRNCAVERGQPASAGMEKVVQCPKWPIRLLTESDLQGELGCEAFEDRRSGDDRRLDGV